jgi:hypothetical protein
MVVASMAKRDGSHSRPVFRESDNNVQLLENAFAAMSPSVGISD